MITNASKKPMSFTELLHVTKLCRKTLSLRLAELCTNGALVKKEGRYELNGGSDFKSKSVSPLKKLSRVYCNRRTRTGFMLVMLLLCFSTSGYVLARFFTPPTHIEVSQEPVIIGSFTAAVEVVNVEDLYAWQVLIAYSPSELRVLEVIPGGFVGSEYPSSNAADLTSTGVFMNATDIGDGRLLLGGSLCGNVPGKSGNGTLAIIVFGYFMDTYQEPEIVWMQKPSENRLLNSDGFDIPTEGATNISLTFMD